MTKEEFELLQVDVRNMKSQLVRTSFGAVPASIPHLAQLIERTKAGDELTADALYSLLLSECSKAKNDDIYLHYLKKRCAEDDTNILAFASMGDALSVIDPNNEVDALLAASRALELAKAQNRLVRYCATNLVRISLRIKNYQYLTMALQDLVNDAKAVRLEDSPYAFDFIEQIDLRKCDNELVRQYKALASPV